MKTLRIVLYVIFIGLAVYVTFFKKKNPIQKIQYQFDIQDRYKINDTVEVDVTKYYSFDSVVLYYNDGERLVSKSSKLDTY